MMESNNVMTVQAALDRMVPDPRTYEVLIEKLNDCLWSDVQGGREETLSELAESLHRKALGEERLTSVYADCAGDVSRMLKKRQKEPLRKDFCSALLKSCKQVFDELLVLQLHEEDEYAESKARKLSNMRFIAELYNRCILLSESVTPFLDVLMGVDSDIPPSTDNVEALRDFLMATSTSLDPVMASAVTQRVRKIHDTHPSSRVRNILSDVMDFNPPPAPVANDSSGTSEPPSSPSDLSFPMSSPPHMELQPAHCPGPKGGEMQLQRMGSYQMQGGRKTKKDHKAYQMQQQQRRENTVYIVGIDASLPEGDLLSFISQCGNLVKVRLCGDTTNRTIYGFFEFDSKDSAETLVAKTGSVLGNYTIHCSFARQAIRDLSQPADSKIRTFCFDNKQEFGETALRESVLNDPTWFKSQGRSKQKVHSSYNNGWESNRIPAEEPHQGRHMQSLHSMVRHMAQTHSVPHNVTLQMGDLAMAFASTAIGEGEWASLIDYMAPFLRAVEKVFRIAALQVVLEGVDRFMNTVPQMNQSNAYTAWLRLATIIALCFKGDLLNIEDMQQVVHNLSYTDATSWLQFSTELASTLMNLGYDFAIVHDIIPSM